jgi:hypothetical protein
LLVFLLLGNVVVAEDEDPNPSEPCYELARKAEAFARAGHTYAWIEVEHCEELSTVRCKGWGPYTCSVTNINIWNDNVCPDPVGIPNLQVFTQAQADDMHQYVEDRVAAGEDSGSYNSNIYRVDLGITYYRTITWEYDPVTELLKDELTVCPVND